MGVRMSRTPGGGSSKSSDCVHGKTGERGMGRNYSGNNFKSPVWTPTPSKTKAKDGSKVGPMKTQPDNFYKLSRNPSGASNRPLGARDRDFRDTDF